MTHAYTKTDRSFYVFGDGPIKMALDNRTNSHVACALYSAYRRRVRVRVWIGDTETGHAWLEELDVTGRIAVSMGPRHVPILLHNSRSIGGGSILDHCIVKIQETKSGRVLYEHPTYGRGHFLITPPHGGGIAPPVNLPDGHAVAVHHYHTGDADGWTNVANFRTKDAAQRWVDFMTGKRMTTGGRLAH